MTSASEPPVPEMRTYPCKPNVLGMRQPMACKNLGMAVDGHEMPLMKRNGTERNMNSSIQSSRR